MSARATSSSWRPACRGGRRSTCSSGRGRRSCSVADREAEDFATHPHLPRTGTSLDAARVLDCRTSCVGAGGVRFCAGVQSAANGDQFSLGGQQVRARPRNIGGPEVSGTGTQVPSSDVQPVSQVVAVCRCLLEYFGCHPARLSCTLSHSRPTLTTSAHAAKCARPTAVVDGGAFTGMSAFGRGRRGSAVPVGPP